MMFRKRYVLMIVLAFSVANVFAERGSSSAVEVDFGDAAKELDTESKSLIMEVVATGVGIDPEKAKQNAFSNAIEHAAGVLVDAETLVKNDQLVSDEILTFSRGFVQIYDVVKTWQKENLYYARIWAKVAVSKLAEKLKAHKIAVREVPGELLYRQVKHELITEENAAEMFRRAMQDFRMDKLLKVEIVGKPEVVEKDETHAKLRIKVKLSADMANWAKLRRNLYSLLLRLSSKRAVCTTERRGPVGTWATPLHLHPFYSYSILNRDKLNSRLEGPGGQVYLLKNASPSGSQTTWDVFLVPGSLGPIVADAAEVPFRLCIRLVNATDATIWEIKKDISRLQVSFLPFWLHNGKDLAVCHLDPFLWGGRRWGLYSPGFAVDELADIELEKLSRVAKCVAYIEEVTEVMGDEAASSSTRSRVRGRATRPGRD